MFQLTGKDAVAALVGETRVFRCGRLDQELQLASLI